MIMAVLKVSLLHAFTLIKFYWLFNGHVASSETPSVPIRSVLMQPSLYRALLFERRQFQHKDITNADDGYRGGSKSQGNVFFGSYSVTENSFSPSRKANLKWFRYFFYWFSLSLVSELFVSITVTAHRVKAFLYCSSFFQLNFQVCSKTSLLSNLIYLSIRRRTVKNKIYSGESRKRLFFKYLFTILKIHWTITAFTCNMFETRVTWLLPGSSKANLFSVYTKWNVFYRNWLSGMDQECPFSAELFPQTPLTALLIRWK